MADFLFKGLPSDVLTRNAQDEYGVSTIDGVMNKSKSYLFTGNLTAYSLLAPTSGNFLIIKGFTIIGDGVTGTIKIFRTLNNQCVLPCYMSSKTTASASNALNLVLNVDETLYITTTGRGVDAETFVGVSYQEMNPSTML